MATVAGVVDVSVAGSLVFSFGVVLYVVLELLLLGFLLRRLRPGVIASRSQDIIQPFKKKGGVTGYDSIVASNSVGINGFFLRKGRYFSSTVPIR
jgi:hypothetical protein